MRFRLLTFCLFLYISADFANPLMPGAVTFIDGTVESLDVERTWIAEAVPDAPVVIRLLRIEAAPLVSHPGRPAVIRPAMSWRSSVRGAVFTQPDPPPPPEDH